MWTPPDPPLAIEGVSAATLRSLAAAFRSGQLTTPLSAFALTSTGSCPSTLAADLLRFSAEGMSPAHLATLLDLAAHALEARLLRDSVAELVWTGPETVHARSRETLVVIDELFSAAQQSVLVSTYVVQQPERIFAKLAARLDNVPGLVARVFVNVERKSGDTRLESGLVHEHSTQLASRWPGTRRPEVYFDPRSVSTDAAVRASWHAKCVVVDDEVTFLTSANFTEWAQQRNVEAGALIRGRHFALQLRSQLESLIQSKQVKRMPGF